jgi:hypothetical protein
LFRGERASRGGRAFGGDPGRDRPGRSAGQSATDNPMDHIAGFHELGLGEGVEDRRAGPARVYQTG